MTLIYVGLFLLVGTAVSILLFHFLSRAERRRRDRLSDSAGAKAFEDQLHKERMRRVDRG